jgi:hypothetical protein
MELCMRVETYEFVGQACVNVGLLGSVAFAMIVNSFDHNLASCGKTNA